MVAQLFLVQFVGVQIPVGLPSFKPRKSLRGFFVGRT
jgi:hypothetical protein